MPDIIITYMKQRQPSRIDDDDGQLSINNTYKSWTSSHTWHKLTGLARKA